MARVDAGGQVRELAWQSALTEALFVYASPRLHGLPFEDVAEMVRGLELKTLVATSLLKQSGAEAMVVLLRPSKA